MNPGLRRMSSVCWSLMSSVVPSHYNYNGFYRIDTARVVVAERSAAKNQKASCSIRQTSFRNPQYLGSKAVYPPIFFLLLATRHLFRRFISILIPIR